MRPPLFLIFLTIFFVVFFLLSFFDPSPPATIPTLGFQNDFVILKDYWETGRGYTGGIFTLDKYQALNQEYGNIFSYFELPSNPDGKIVSLKGPGKILLKAPIFLLSEGFFPTIWKFLGGFLVFGFAILLHRKIYGKKDIILLMLLVFAFAPFQLFDLEYATLFFSASSLYFYSSSKKRPYLFMYFLFGIYASISRSDFFIFFSCFNIYFLVHSFSSGETLKKIFYVFSASTLFLAAFFLLNKIYYGGFFTLGYEVQSSSASVFASDTFNTVPVSLLSRILFNINKVSGYFLPYGFHISSISDNVLYVIGGQTGVLLAFLIPSFFSKKFFIQGPFRLKLFILLIIFYSFAFYGSDANSYKPPSPQFSSYTRYFSIFLFMFWIFFYSYFFQISRFSKILLSSFLIFLIFTGIHFTERPSNDLYSIKYINYLEKFIPKGSVILPLRPVQFLLSDYKILQPSGSDSEEYKVYFTFGRTARPTSAFLEKIYTFIIKNQTPIYIVGKGQYFLKITDFFKRYDSSIKIEYYPQYTVIYPKDITNTDNIMETLNLNLSY